jgi:hypothetical protein
MFLKKNRQTEDWKREKQKSKKKKTPFSHHATKHKEKLFYNKVHYLVPHALRTSIAQKKKKEKRRAGGGVLAE